MVNGLKFIKEDGMDVRADDSEYAFDTEDDFIESASKYYNKNEFLCYYFGDGEDGAMKTNKTNITIDGDNFNFYFEKSGSKKGSGVNGEKDDKYYLAGMLLKAGSDDKYQAIQNVTAEGKAETWKKLDDAQAVLNSDAVVVKSDTVTADNVAAAKEAASSFNKKVEDLKELYVLEKNDLKLINTSGKVVDKKGKSKDGNDYVYVTDNSGVIRVIYVED